MQYLQMQFSKDETDSPAGTAKLTNCSTFIGKNLARKFSREPLKPKMLLALGDIMIEGFLIEGLIELEYPKTRDSSYIIKATKRWAELANIPEIKERIRITATTDVKPEDITKHEQKVLDRTISLIKESTSEINREAPWVHAINNLQQCGWRINRRILDALHDNRDLFVSEEVVEDNDAKEQKRRSKLLEWDFITVKADMLCDEVFYQYLDCDYRGRFYYIEPFLNFQGSDVARGLLKFAEGKPMNSAGIRWLSIHTASSFNQSYSIDEIPDWCEADYRTHLLDEGLDNISVDKMTLEDRVRWTDENMEKILAHAAEASFDMDAEKPVAFLAACFEWLDYSDALIEGRTHISRLPIPIDGSNNGWQHLGAISKDPHTGKLVGLVPVEIQQDFYVQTAKQLIEICQDDDLSNMLSVMPMKKIRKGISKRGSMTRAYSAGQQKIAENMYFDCKTEDYHIEYGINEKDCSKLAGLLIKAIDAVCPGPLTTMGYLQDLAAFEIGRYELVDEDGEPAAKLFKQMKARRKKLLMEPELCDLELEELDTLTKELDKFEYVPVYGNEAKSLSWKTPSGFNVVYENWTTMPLKIKGSLGKGKRVTHVLQESTDKPDMRGFMCGVSPNFIHSMDASHMALVISRWDGCFGAVHDSYSTHACDVDDMLALTKEVFIEMYDVDNFYDYIEDQLITDKTELDVMQPALGTLDIGGIENSDYFFA